jgi:hypothetical protein
MASGGVFLCSPLVSRYNSQVSFHKDYSKNSIKRIVRVGRSVGQGRLCIQDVV